jgi:hypothetical protein
VPLPTKRDERRIWPPLVRATHCMPLHLGPVPLAEVVVATTTTPAVTAAEAGGERPASSGASRRDRRPARASAERTKNRGDGEHASEIAHREHREDTTDDTSTTPPERATRPRYMTFTTLTPSRAPLDCPPRLLLPAHPHARPIPLAAAPPPAFQLHAWAALPTPVLFGKSRKGVQRVSGGPPSSEAQV